MSKDETGSKFILTVVVGMLGAFLYWLLALALLQAFRADAALAGLYAMVGYQSGVSILRRAIDDD